MPTDTWSAHARARASSEDAIDVATEAGIAAQAELRLFNGPQSRGALNLYSGNRCVRVSGIAGCPVRTSVDGRHQTATSGCAESPGDRRRRGNWALAAVETAEMLRDESRDRPHGRIVSSRSDRTPLVGRPDTVPPSCGHFAIPCPRLNAPSPRAPAGTPAGAVHSSVSGPKDATSPDDAPTSIAASENKAVLCMGSATSGTGDAPSIWRPTRVPQSLFH